MHDLKPRVSAAVAACVLSLAVAPAAAQGISDRVSALEARVAALEADLEAAFAPRTIVVNCANGQTVNAALAQMAGRAAQLTIRVVGMCTEAVTIQRDDVTLRGMNPGDGIAAPSPQDLAVSVSGQRVTVERLALQGGSSGLQLSGGSSVTASNLVISGAASGARVTLGSHLALSNSVIENNGVGIQASLGARITLIDTTIHQHSFGVVLQSSFLSAFSSVIADSVIGGVSMSLGSTASLGNATIVENNGVLGMYAVGGSSISLMDATIRGNGAGGVRLADVSVISGNPSASIVANGGWGVLCAPAPAVPQISEAIPNGGISLGAANVHGNTAGQINCPGVLVP